MTIALEDRKGHSLQREINAYDGPYYKDTRGGCDISPAHAKSLHNHVPCSFQKSNLLPSDLDSLSKPSSLLVDSVTFRSYGCPYDWWRTRESRECFASAGFGNAWQRRQKKAVGSARDAGMKLM